MKEWILDVIRIGRRGFSVCLRQVIVLEGGLRIMTGVRTPPFAFDFMRGDYVGMAERLARSLDVMTAEVVSRRDEEELVVAGELGEQLMEILGGDGDV